VARTTRRSTTPLPSSPTPIAIHAHTFIPVNGRLPPCALADAFELEPDEVEVPLAGDDGADEGDELLVDDELLELEEFDDDDELLLDEELLW
jgi:hypothetical protein